MPVIAEWTQFIMSIWTLIGVIFFVIYQTVKFTTYKNTMDNRMSIVEKDNERQQHCIDTLTDKVNWNDVVVMEIKTKLVNIEALLMDMKQQIKNK